MRHEAYLWGSLDKVGSECSAGVPPEGAQEEAIIGVLIGNGSETKHCNVCLKTCEFKETQAQHT